MGGYWNLNSTLKLYATHLNALWWGMCDLSIDLVDSHSAEELSCISLDPERDC